MVARVVGHAGLGEEAARGDEAGDAAAREFVPADVEGQQLWELQLAIGQMVVDPPRHRRPLDTLGVFVDEPRDNDGRHGAHAAVATALVPDVVSAVGFVRGTAIAMRVAKAVDLGRAIGRADGDAPERRLQWLQQVFAQSPARGDRKVRIVR